MTIQRAPHATTLRAATATALLSLATPLAAELNLLHRTVVDPSALNFSSASAKFSQNINGRSYQRSPITTYRGYQYVTYYNTDRRVCLARRKLPFGGWQVIRFTDYTIPGHDSHNVATLGICALDGTIHLAFDHHNDPLNYRVSDRGVATSPASVVWSRDLFGPVGNSLGSVGVLPRVTYPSFFSAPNGNLMLYYRQDGSGNGDGMLLEYDGTTSDWTTGMGKFISRSGSYTGALSTNSTSRNPYINGIGYAGDRLHVSWGWRESAGGSEFNHDLNYAYSDDDGRTWRNSAGNRIGTTGSSFINVNSPGLIVAGIPQDIGLSNQYTHYAYPDGSCHVVVQHDQSGTNDRRYHHYTRDASGDWSSAALPFSGSRPKVVGDDDGCLFLAYTSGGVLRIAKGTPDRSTTSWSWEEIHRQSDTTEGGEGIIDAARWESDRILSVYGQVKPASDGQATPLHTFDYQVSAKAVLPEPTYGQQDVDTSTDLQWTAGIGARSHRVYLGTDPAAVASASPASPEYQGLQTGTRFTPPAPLSSATTYYWRIDEIDPQRRLHHGLLWSFDTALPSSLDTLYSDRNDASIRENPDVVDVGNPTTLLGTGGSRPWVDRCTVYVFQLPDLGKISSPFNFASFSFDYADKQNTLQNNDLYGLGRRPDPEVLPGDYYGQTPTPDPDATLLQARILDNATPFGLVSTSASGRGALAAYLNAQYGAGAGAGEFVFLRLNTAGAKDGIDRATLTMSEGGSPGPVDTRPRIDYSAARSALQQWRLAHFSTPLGSGDASDDADPDADGETNFLEFATGQNPHAKTAASTRLAVAGDALEFTYFRRSDAPLEGLRFEVQSSASLRPNSWTGQGVSETVISDNGTVQTVIASVPSATATPRFIRLRVTRD